MQKEVLSVLVENNAGVLARVSSLFGQRGFNIDSLTVSATDDPHISRITIVVCGDADEIAQVVSQTMKLTETRDVYVLDADNTVMRELLLIKLPVEQSTLGPIRETANIYGANIVDLSPDTLIIELTGLPGKIDAFLEVIAQYGVLELCRTGITAMERGRKR